VWLTTGCAKVSCFFGPKNGMSGFAFTKKLGNGSRNTIIWNVGKMQLIQCRKDMKNDIIHHNSQYLNKIVHVELFFPMTTLSSFSTRLRPTFGRNYFCRKAGSRNKSLSARLELGTWKGGER
jgi:hypothetical protein